MEKKKTQAQISPQPHQLAFNGAKQELKKYLCVINCLLLDICLLTCLPTVVKIVPSPLLND